MAAAKMETSRRHAASRVVQAVLMAGIVALAAAATYISILVFERQETLQKFSRYNVAFSASQGMNELLRFRHRLAGVLVTPPIATPDEVELRFQILLSRIDLMQSGEFGAFTHSTPTTMQTIHELAEAANAISLFIDQIERQENARRALELTKPLETKLIALASEANEYSATSMARAQNELLRLHRIFSLLALALVLGGFVLVALLRWQHKLQLNANQRLEATHEDLQRTSAELAAAAASAQHVNEEFANQNLLFDTALNNMSHGLCMFDGKHRLIVSNRQMETVYGLSDNKLKSGLSLQELTQHIIQAGACSQEEAERICQSQEALVETNKSDTLTQELRDGRTIQISHQPMEGGGWVAIYEDITARHKAQAQVAYMARHDMLTQLPNRYMMREELAESLSTSQARKRHVAVMCIDLDNFKGINDTLGHPVGDTLLRTVAERINRTIRKTDSVARLGGDEFVVIQANMARTEDATRLARRLIDAIDEPYLIDGHQVLTGASLGIATTQDGNRDVDDLLMRADVALYQAKAEGRGIFRFYEPEMNKRLQRRRHLEAALRAADFDEQFKLVFQPIVDLGRNKVTAVEALLRWKHPTYGTIPPDEFIPIAEESGTILALGEWVLRKACLATHDLPAHINVAANLSPMQFKRASIVETVSRLLDETKTDPHRLDLEITETLLLDDNRKLNTDLRRLRKLGTRISLDDFGTGYSSLSYLQKFAVDKIKIDQLFVRDIIKSPNQAAIVQTIVSLAETLGMTIVVEGVETKEQLRILRAMGCDEAQGHLFSKPIDYDHIKAYLVQFERNLSAA